MAAADQLTGFLNLINSVQGKSQTTTTSGGTQTTQTPVSDQGVQTLIKGILSGQGGVKNIGSRARSSGLYNSTSEDILLGNLYSEAANKAELARTPTITTTAPQTQVTKTPGIGLEGLATNLGGAFLASQAINLGAKALSPALEEGGNFIADLLGIELGSSGSGSKVKLGDLDVSAGGGFGGGFGGGDTSISTGEGYNIDTSTLGSFGGNTSTPGAKGINFGFDTDTGATSANLGGFGALGGLLGSVLQGFSGGSSGGGGGGGGTSGGSVICTALKDLGFLDKELHAAGSKYLNKMNPITVIGYQVWGNKIADKIREGHKGWTKVALPIARSRTSLLASGGSFMDHVKHPLGTFTKFIGEPICHLIGLCVPDDLFIDLMQKYYAQKGV
ncbi:hypothetical protein D3C81_743070 [compost metagenome]